MTDAKDCKCIAGWNHVAKEVFDLAGSECQSGGVEQMLEDHLSDLSWAAHQCVLVGLLARGKKRGLLVAGKDSHFHRRVRDHDG